MGPRAIAAVLLALAVPVAGEEWKRGDDAPAPAPVERSRNWAALTPGMTKGQVRGILGEPQQVEAHEGAVDVWIYRGDGPHMSGRVTFREGLLETSGP